MLNLYTFGFKYGLPPCNFIYDVTFLENPARKKGRHLNSELSISMVTEIKENPKSSELVTHIVDLCEFLVTTNMEIRLGIGCNSGQHRSRVIAQMISDDLTQKNILHNLVHREDVAW